MCGVRPDVMQVAVASRKNEQHSCPGILPKTSEIRHSHNRDSIISETVKQKHNNRSCDCDVRLGVQSKQNVLANALFMQRQTLALIFRYY
jgi:hypothetical protein